MTDGPGKQGVTLGVIAETLLIPLYGRAELTRQGSRLISDPEAVEMVESIDYDFAKFQGPSLFGSVLRTRMLDLWVQQWLSDNPAGTVVEIGAGLNARYERIDNGTARWIELDVPDAMALRHRFFRASDRRRMIAASVTDETWIPLVAASPGPWFFVVEAVLSFLPEGDVRRALSSIVNHFGGARIALDTWGTYMRSNQDSHDALKVMDARVEWFADTASDVEQLVPGLRCLDSRTLSDCQPELVELMSVAEQETFESASSDPQARAYKLNLFAATS